MRTVLDEGLGRDRIGNYRIEHELGPTGSGILFQVRHQVLPRRAIVKVVHAAFASGTYAVQTLREACILEAVGHPGVPIVYESGLLPDRRPWFAFEVITGPTLEEVFAPGPIAIGKLVRMIRDVAEILEHAHARGVIHRGLRPERVIVTRRRRFPLCIPDWSEAIAHDASESSPPPDGTWGYVAPELRHQDSGWAERVDDRADVFALGAIAYRGLTGMPPFDADCDAPYIPARELCRAAPGRLAMLVDSLLSFDRFDRPSAREVRSDLDALLSGHPELQQHAALGEPAIDEPSAVAPDLADPTPHVVVLDRARRRRPRWTPSVHRVHYPDTTDDAFTDEDRTRR